MSDSLQMFGGQRGGIVRNEDPIGGNEAERQVGGSVG